MENNVPLGEVGVVPEDVVPVGRIGSMTEG